MSDTEANQYAEEWRAIVLKKLDSIEQEQRDVRRELKEHQWLMVSKDTFSKFEQDVESLEERITNLEKFKWQLVGAMALVNFVVLIIFHYGRILLGK
jgi:hypothetical protein